MRLGFRALTHGLDRSVNTATDYPRKNVYTEEKKFLVYAIVARVVNAHLR